MINEAIFLGIFIIVLGGLASEIYPAGEGVIAVTPTSEIIVASGFTRDGIYFELKEYQTAEGIILSSFKTLDLNKRIKIRGQIIGISDEKYVFSVKETVIDLAIFAKK